MNLHPDRAGGGASLRPLGRDEGRELLGQTGIGMHAEPGDDRSRLRARQALADRGIELAHDRLRGEDGTTPVLAVVINAIVDALSEFGVTHVEMPATPERVWRAIQDAQLKQRGMP